MNSNRDYATENINLKKRLEVLEHYQASAIALTKENMALYQENEKLKNENQILNQNVKDTYDSSQDIIYELQEEIKKLKLSIDEEIKNYQEMAKLYVKESNEREKLMKFIETLKFYFFIDIIQRETDYKLGFEPVVPIDDQPRFSIITSSDGELVEEILNRKAIVDLCFKDTL